MAEGDLFASYDRTVPMYVNKVVYCFLVETLHDARMSWAADSETPW